MSRTLKKPAIVLADIITCILRFFKSTSSVLLCDVHLHKTGFLHLGLKVEKVSNIFNILVIFTKISTCFHLTTDIKTYKIEY